MNECISKKLTTVRALASKENIELAGLEKAFMAASPTEMP
jgi:hypothetical protein